MACKTFVDTCEAVYIGAWDCHVNCIYIFHPAPGKVEVKHQSIQTKTIEIKDQQVQTETIAQEQGTCILIIFTVNCFDVRNTLNSIHEHVLNCSLSDYSTHTRS